MVNCLQMMVYVALFNLNFPLNVTMFFSLIITVTMFDLLPSTKLGYLIFGFNTEISLDEAYSEQFSEADIF